MENKKNNELENLENWDIEKAQIKRPVKKSRVVVSIALQHDEFELISKHAELLGKKTSQFIREAAIEKTLQIGESLLFSSMSGSSGSSWAINHLGTMTIAQGQQVEENPESKVITG